MTRETVLITPLELQGMFEAGRPVTILDVRWWLGRDDGFEQYMAGHIPGAVFVDLETELAGASSSESGRHPLPDVAALESDARRWGVRATVPVVVYDDGSSLSAARGWWILRWAGKRQVRILDGGLAAWTAADGAVENEVVRPEPGDVEFVGAQMPTLSPDEAQALAAGEARDGLLLDARAPERFTGESEWLDSRAGHIPGAINRPTALNSAPEGGFLSADDLREQFIAAGLDVDSHVPGTPGPDHRVGVYCGSGVNACHQIAALASIGLEAGLYPGSWSQWAADDARPIETGAGGAE